MISIFTTLKQEPNKKNGGLRPPFIYTARAVLLGRGAPAPLGPPATAF